MVSKRSGIVKLIKTWKNRKKLQIRDSQVNPLYRSSPHHTVGTWHCVFLNVRNLESSSVHSRTEFIRFLITVRGSILWLREALFPSVSGLNPMSVLRSSSVRSDNNYFLWRGSEGGTHARGHRQFETWIIGGPKIRCSKFALASGIGRLRDPFLDLSGVTFLKKVNKNATCS